VHGTEPSLARRVAKWKSVAGNGEVGRVAVAIDTCDPGEARRFMTAPGSASGFTVPKMIKAVDSARNFLALIDRAT